MKITPLAAESMGVRSMATFVETNQVKLIIDPGASLSPNRHDLPPHQLEEWRLKQCIERIRLFACSSQAILITCFHDGHFLGNPEIYQDKVLFLQNPNARASVQYRTKAFQFLNRIKGLPKDIIYMDDRKYELGNIQLEFSKPLRSSTEDSTDHVIMCALKQADETFVYSSNIQGLLEDQQLSWISKHPANIIYLDGPILFNLAQRFTDERINRFILNMGRLLDDTKIHELILDHHITRDSAWREKMEPLFKLALQKAVSVQTAAEYRGEINDYLESRRQFLYQNDVLQS